MGIEHRFKEDIPLSVMNRVQYYINQNTRGNSQPEKIWLNKEDFKQIYSELKQIQRKIYVHERMIESPYRSVLFCGSDIVYNPDANPLPDTYEGMNEWVNKPLEESKSASTSR